MESEISSIEKRFAYGFLQKLLKWMEIAQEFIAHLGTVVQGLATDTVALDRLFLLFHLFNHLFLGSCSPEAVVSSGRVEKSPHEQEIKFFAKVCLLHQS